MAPKAVVVCGRWCLEWDELREAVTTITCCMDYMDEVIGANFFQPPLVFLAFQRSVAFICDLQARGANRFT